MSTNTRDDIDEPVAEIVETIGIDSITDSGQTSSLTNVFNEANDRSADQLNRESAQDVFTAPPVRSKRPSSTSASSCEDNSQGVQRPAKTVKKSKTEFSIEVLREQLKPAIPFFEEKYPDSSVHLNNLEDFLYRSHGNPNTVGIAREIWPDLTETKNLLLETRDHVSDRNTKSRLTKITKKLELAIQGKPVPAGSDDEMSSTDEPSQNHTMQQLV
ncbi:hypothetical protein QAD02_003564 [Eretmocerus hayati]|uniref:Uncharacterized protein n=1 Tax=Eretmocerus hayati TaxID=131215 RepID=A0ACC2NMB2_9HYME|nr:hypothetical protein QAD02_003564 [Eretmocerus hayati]